MKNNGQKITKFLNSDIKSLTLFSIASMTTHRIMSNDLTGKIYLSSYNKIWQIMESNELLDLNTIGKIYAGEVHFSRIPVEYWEHRIQMIKALGLNTLSVYIMWNYH